jgi:3'-phosphoadenosine 5'-phosphosulfate sulfotransferase (PAPS reductase)/FAD synthetase
MPTYSMSCPVPAHLKRLEAESVGIIREVAAEFLRPVLLYLIGKDSSVMLRLVLKAFYPEKPQFPLLHVDTTWKFRDMIRFRDEVTTKLGLELIVHVNKEGLARGINPFTSGSVLHTNGMKTEALKQAIDLYGIDAAFDGASRDEEKNRAKERIFPSAASVTHGIPVINSPSYGGSSIPRSARVTRFGYFHYRIGPRSTCGTPRASRSYRSTLPQNVSWSGTRVYLS